MRCPWCGHEDDKVIDSRPADGGESVRRRRQCLSCRRRYTTFERVEGAALMVVKRSGVRVPFDRAKVIAGLTKACVNRPVAEEDVDRVADEIEQYPLRLRLRRRDLPRQDGSGGAPLGRSGRHRRRCYRRIRWSTSRLNSPAM